MLAPISRNLAVFAVISVLGLIPPSSVQADGDGEAACEDCNDDDSTVHTAASESCNSIDDNCDGQIDEAGAPRIDFPLNHAPLAQQS